MSKPLPATDLLLGRMADCVKDVREHQHPDRGEDLYCLNLHAFMGERMAAVLQRVADEQAEVRRWRDRHTALADESTAMATESRTVEITDEMVAAVCAEVDYFGFDLGEGNARTVARAALEAAGFTVAGGDAR